MALAIPAQVSENPELDAFKANLIKVADVYTKRHGWCDQVNKALKEMGVERTDVKTVRGVTRVHLVVDIEHDFIESDFAGLDPEAERAKAAEVLADKFKPSKKGVSLVEAFVQAVNHAPEPAPGETEEYPGYVRRYISIEGRVQHLFPEDTNFDYWDGMRDAMLCHDSYAYGPLSAAREDSLRGEGRVCVKCQRAYARLTA